MSKFMIDERQYFVNKRRRRKKTQQKEKSELLQIFDTSIEDRP